MAINKIYRALYYGNILKDSTNSKKMWDNINVIINKKRSSSNIEKLQVNDENFEQLFSISNAINNGISAVFKPNLHLNCPNYITVPLLTSTGKKKRFALLE